jgi:uncharacterized protein (TIGR02270 family)
MSMSASRLIRWDIYEEHFDEAAWLWGEWAESLNSPLYCLREIADGPEERLLAHLDGLVLGGLPVAEKLLLPALASEELGEVMTAAWALLQAEDADHQDTVFEKLGSAEPPALAAIWRAISLSPRADISRLIPSWHQGAPATRALVFDIFAPREPGWTQDHLGEALCSGQPELVAAGLRAARSLRHRGSLDRVRATLDHPHPDVQHEAMTTGLALGLKDTWALCRRLGGAQGPNCRLALGLLCTSLDAKDRTVAADRLKEPSMREDALWALGFCPSVKAIDLLIEAMADPKVAKLAAESFTAITGTPIEGDLAKVGEPVPPDVEEVKPDDPVPVVRSVDFLREPKVEAVAKWWNRQRPKFHPQVRHIQGQPRTTEAMRAAFLTSTTWRLEVQLTELAMYLVSPPRCDLGNWAKTQIEQFTQVRPVVVDRKDIPTQPKKTLQPW